MIKLENVTKTFMVGEQTLTVADKISFEIKDNEFVSLVGRSGSGKSTLLNMIGGLLKPDDGDIIVDDKNISSFGEKELSDYRAFMTGYIFQAFHLEPMYTVSENLRIGLMPYKLSTSERKSRIDKALTEVGLTDKKNVKVCKLSGGEKQRVAIARALAKDAKVILADEPCGNLDSENAAGIMELLKKANKEGRTVILVTHSEKDAALADRIIRLNDGKVVSDENI